MTVHIHMLKKFWVIPQLFKQVEIAASFNLVLLEIHLIHTSNLKTQERI